MIDQTTGVKGDDSVKGASAGATTFGVASAIADGNNAVAFACRAGGRMIDSTAGVKGDVSAKRASAGATTFVVASTTADGDNAAAFACRAGGRMIGLTADVEGGFSDTRDDERLPFWPVQEVRGLFELVMAIGNRGLPTHLKWQACGSGYHSLQINWIFFCSRI